MTAGARQAPVFWAERRRADVATLIARDTRSVDDS